MGVWALTQEQKGDAVMFFQLSISKQGVISGAYKNTLTGGSEQIIGSVDGESQLAAWRVGQNGKTIIETGLYNLTKDVTSAAIHFDTGNTQTWLMVRLLNQPCPTSRPKWKRSIGLHHRIRRQKRRADQPANPRRQPEAALIAGPR